ncbi:MAG: DUF1285 domain-containing protein [Pseudomonadota bacterium]
MDTLTPFETLLFAAGSGRRTPPVDRWDPPLCGSIDIRIAADGTWYHEGGPINRTRLARLFSSLLRKDEDGVTYLVTPHEKLAIAVDDAPLIGVDHAIRDTKDGPVLALRTNMDDFLEIGSEHPIRFEVEPETGGIKPYALVRGRIEALINRSTTMAILSDDRLVGFSDEQPILRSGGEVFPITLV